MKRAPYIAAIALVGLFAAETVWAQQAPGRGMGFGRFMSPEASAEVVCDVILLEGEKAEQVKTAYLETMQSQTGRGFPQGLQDMTAEQRREAMQEIRTQQADAVVEALGDLVNEEESKAIHNVIVTNRLNVIPEVRALRMIGIDEEKRAELLPIVFELVETVPVLGFGAFGGGQGGAGAQAAREAAEKREELNTQIAAALSQEQVEAWKEKTAEIEAEEQRRLEELRQQRGGGGGGQPRGGAGGGRQGT